MGSDGGRDTRDLQNASADEEPGSPEPRPRPRLASRGSEMSDFQAWNEAHIMSSDSEFDYNPGPDSTALRIGTT
ncbi:unnamed protein product, partial [Durusdinium trenchii]